MSKPDKKKKEAEAAPAEGEDGAAPKKKGLPIMLIAIIGGAVLLLGGGGAAAYFLFLAPKTPPAAEASAHGEKAEEKHDKKDKKKEGGGHGGGGDAKVDPKTQPVIEEGPGGISYFKLPDTIANIESPDGAKTLLKLQLTFECPDEETAEALKESMPRINDVLQGFIRELRPDDLQGSAGNMQLRQEILRRVNLVVQPHKINAVLIQQMVVN